MFYIIKKRKLDNKTLKAFKIGYSGEYNELYKHLVSKGFKENEMYKYCITTPEGEKLYKADPFANHAELHDCKKTTSYLFPL